MKRTLGLLGLLFALVLAGCGTGGPTHVPTGPGVTTIDVQVGTTTMTISPGDVTTVPTGTTDIYILVHFPQALDPTLVQAQLLPPLPSSWQLHGKNPPTGDSYAFALTGSEDVYMTVAITPGQGMAPLYFSVRVGAATPDVVLADNGRAITLAVGESFLLYLGEDYTWTVIVADQGIVSRVKNVLVIRGAQGLYQALQSGRTTLTAQGDPVCRSANPPCAAPSRTFEVTLVVK